ncbi:MAG: hypothetical protein A4E49_03162 [Methanosaeta sp. PtaU1.Bin112]|nr:MAG: hypothetical protein A4E49_03162 [Methanosaeta sp. PtaU1.Bin112]
MSGSIVSAHTNNLLPAPHVLSPLCGMVHGLLQIVEPADGCVIAAFHCNAGDVRVALPEGLDLPVGLRIGICRDDDRYIVRRLV